MMGRQKLDLMGQRFGNLTVIAPAAPNRWKQSRWLCRCDCGNTGTVIGNNLVTGKVRSCGCFKRNKPKEDLTGRRFGSWTAIRYATDEETAMYSSPGGWWLCRCDCGNERLVKTHALKSGESKSCGCRTSTRMDLTGQRYGSWTVLRRATEDEARYYAASKAIFWKCRCDCGKESIVSSGQLRSGRSRSCGCRSWKKREAGNVRAQD